MEKIDKNKITIQSYEKNPSFYAEIFNSYGAQVEDTKRVINLNNSKQKKVLELGSGNGRDAEYIIDLLGSENYVGIDASASLVEIAKKRIPKGTFHVKDFREDLSILGDSFGVILSFYSLLHVKREELGQIIRNCLKCLAVGGTFGIFTKYGEYRELEIVNLGEKKYYYPYKPEDILSFFSENEIEVCYKVIKDSDYGPSFGLILRKL